MKPFLVIVAFAFNLIFFSEALALQQAAQSTLTMNLGGTGPGTVTITNNRTAETKTCSYTCNTSPPWSCAAPPQCAVNNYRAGDTYTIRAVPATNHPLMVVFEGWSGGSCSGSGDCVLTMNNNLSLSVTFTAKVNLKITKTGSGSGTVTGPGISCGSDCSESLPLGAVPTLTATPERNSYMLNVDTLRCPSDRSNLVRQGSVGFGEIGIVEIGLTKGDCEIRVEFGPVPKVKFKVTKIGTGTGVVTGQGGPWLHCGNACSVDVPIGSLISVNAVPDRSFMVKNIDQVNCSLIGTPPISSFSPQRDGTGTYTIGRLGSLAPDCEVRVEFVPVPKVTLKVKKIGTGTGVVTGQGINCGSDCSESLPTASGVELTAAPDSSSIFKGWTGAGCSGVQKCSFSLGQMDTEVTAEFGARFPTAAPHPQKKN